MYERGKYMESITLATAREMVQKNRERSKLFNRETDLVDFCQRLENGGFSKAEITVIVAGLRLAGAKFKKEN